VGDNLIANQLSATNNTLDLILSAGVPNGSTFARWDPVAHAFLPSSVFDAGSGQWSINYALNPVDGVGGLLHTPSIFTNTFVGEVYQGSDPAHQVDGALFGVWDGTPRGGGLLLLACQDPIVADFLHVVGRPPVDGEWVRMLNEPSQTYSLTTFHSGSGWDNGVPTLGVGQSAFFQLVPEPGSAAFVGLGLGLAFASRRRDLIG
jgi:hypothetical protein